MSTRKTQMKTSRPRKRDATSIGVYLRLRPLKKEEPRIFKLNDQQVKTLPPDGSNPQVFTFTKVFDNASQTQIFEQVAQPVLEDFIVTAKDGLLFTYGITGSGKTYTMEGARSDPGLIYRSIDFLFNTIGAQQTNRSLIQIDNQNNCHLNWETTKQLYPNLCRPTTPSALPSVIKWQQRAKQASSVSVDPFKYFAVFISLVELYNKQVHDLFEDLDSFEKKRREIRTDQRGISFVANVVEAEVKSADEAVEMYKRGISRRKITSTALNQESSRGHCVLTLRLVQIHKSPHGDFDEDTLVSSQLCLVDLAGSERTKRSGVTGGALHETGSINNSLGALRKCIRALRDREPTSNIQYREYSLTRLFKSYFEGHGAVRMVLCVKPTDVDFYENNSAMEFGLLSQEVAVDYASPPKMMRRSRSRAQDAITAQMEEYFNLKSKFKPDLNINNDEFIPRWLEKLKSAQAARKSYIETVNAAQREFRLSILRVLDENSMLKRQWCDYKQQIQYLLKNSAPSAPQIDPSSTESIDSRTFPTQSNSSSEAIDYDDQKMVSTPPHNNPRVSSPLRNNPKISSPQRHIPRVSSPPQRNQAVSSLYRQHSGVPIVNPKHQRSLSCSSLYWLKHVPEGLDTGGSVLQPKIANGRVVRHLQSKDLFNKKVGNYAIINQTAEPNGEVVTSVTKGSVIRTPTNGVQVHFNDVETMKQESP